MESHGVEPSQKQKKYDRQLRLWGDHGQAALEASRVCLINGSATGSEILKNLVLPGLGSFTILDNKTVDPSDLGSNFFITSKFIGKPRAQCVTELLLELNPAVRGDFVAQDPHEVMEKRPDFFREFSLVIATQLPESEVRLLARICNEASVPLIAARSYGFIGTLRTVMSTPHCVIESKPDHPFVDLRLNEPWEELRVFAESELARMPTMDDAEAQHIPFALILIACVSKWRAEHDGKLPSTSAEKSQFRDGVRSLARSPDANNIREAVENIYKCYSLPSVPSAVRAILDDPMAVNLLERSCDSPTAGPSPSSSSSSATANPITPFWVLAHAVRKFVECEGAGRLPLPGTIPDMFSDTDRYIRLQRLYQDKAHADMAIVQKYVSHALKTLRRPESFVSADDVRLFCKNVYELRMIKFRSIDQELGESGSTPSSSASSSSLSSISSSPASSDSALQSPQSSASAASSSLPSGLMPSPADGPKTAEFAKWLEEISSGHNAALYMALRAADRFHAHNGRFPGALPDGTAPAGSLDMETEVIQLHSEMHAILAELGLSPTAITRELLAEIVRYGAAELHNVASLLGGVASQEAIKILVRQMVPLNNTFIFNGIVATSNTLEL